MKFRLGLFAFLLFGCFVFNQIFDQVFQPSISNQVVTQQVEDTEDSAMLVRGYDRLVKNIPVISYGIVALIGVGLFYGPLQEKFDEVNWD